jgi:hypothetical protein
LGSTGIQPVLLKFQKFPRVIAMTGFQNYYSEFHKEVGAASKQWQAPRGSLA